MISHAPHVMTLANSIIGVSVLAMPYCFKQCGIILAIVMLTLCSLLSRLSCHYLIKSAVMSRRRNFEYLAFHAFGHMGKFFVELFIIGFLIGTLIAFFVVIGDLGPQIIAKLLNKKPEDIRLSLIIITALFIILPLGMLKNIDSLAIVCTATIGFYFCLVLKVVSDSMDHIFQSDWPSNINYWRSAGLLQCLPIFSMALFCQTQLFEIYESIPNVTLEKMNNVVRGALNICTFVYLFVGFFGYVAYSNQQFSGNILSSFEPSMTSDAMKIGFVLSVIFSFPLVIFPCRASLNSFLFHQVYSHDLTSNHIPETRFFLMTIIIVGVSMITGILMPNIEFVLGFIGSTIGVSICVVCPMLFYLAINTKNTNERLLAQILLFVGIWIMILGTYANLYSIDDSSTTKIAIPTERPLLIQMNNVQFNKISKENNQVIIPQVPEVNDLPIININDDLLKKQQVDIINEPQKIPVVTEKLTKQHDSNVPTESDSIGKKNNKIIKGNIDNIEVFNAEEKIKAIEESMNESVQESKENIRLTLERNKIETKKLIEEQKEILQEQKEILEDLKEQKKSLNQRDILEIHER
ncbi:putative sodium-coupled neutral amino acid transporter 10 [Aphidius gifuensis]|uniref:putative sodium-coupled neutral amino acid transporter 10 n=1 Tax=Aphidius gifuensis TaxID=684658 RepID=UPI001CDBB564|nr:putative sodium-coupled neutral amino acid transporter 10 [Aphidius gifuensis]